ncbi:nonstructural protein [Peromfec virus RodF8_29]|uniref:Nonstructural protein n=1 Tax=Peromfec virus RodF8_29 TaxID=2929367 RepID=A0A976R895_9VIRU|nr:nonstructural protein [Peromfec virus RodF8_29]
MDYGVYAMRDARIGFLSPTIEINDDVAIRNFYHAVTHSDGVLDSFANDFSLYRIGSYESDHAQLIPMSPIQHLAEASAALRSMVKSSGGDV